MPPVWLQDATYFGFEPLELIAVWIAISEVSVEVRDTSGSNACDPGDGRLAVSDCAGGALACATTTSTLV